MIGIQGKYSCLRLFEGHHRVRPHNRKIEAHVLIGTPNLDDHHPPVTELAAAANGGIRSLDRFHREDRSAFDDNRLPNPQLRHGSGNLSSKTDILLLRSAWRPCRQQSFSQDDRRKEPSAIMQGDPFLHQPIAHTRKNRIPASIFELHIEQDAVQIELDTREEQVHRDLPEHHSIRHLFTLQRSDQPAKLSGTHPTDLIHLTGQVGRGGLFDGHRHNLEPLHARFLRSDNWKWASASDDPKALHGYPICSVWRALRTVFIVFGTTPHVARCLLPRDPSRR
jgi:hypothetical protein